MIEFSKNTEMSVRNSTQPDFKVPQLKKNKISSNQFYYVTVEKMNL